MADDSTPPDPVATWVAAYSAAYSANTLAGVQQMLRLFKTAPPGYAQQYAPYALSRLLEPYGTPALLESLLANGYVNTAEFTNVIAAATRKHRPDLVNVLRTWQDVPVSSQEQCHYCDTALTPDNTAMLPCCHRACTTCVTDLTKRNGPVVCKQGVVEGGECNAPFSMEQVVVGGNSPGAPLGTTPGGLQDPGDVTITQRLAMTEAYLATFSQLLQNLHERQRQFGQAQPATAAAIAQATTAAVKTVEGDVDRLLVYRDHLRAAAAARDNTRKSELLRQNPFYLTLTQTVALDGGAVRNVPVGLTGTTVAIGRTRDDLRQLAVSEARPQPAPGWDSVYNIKDVVVLPNGDLVIERVVNRQHAIEVRTTYGELLSTLAQRGSQFKFSVTSDNDVWVLAPAIAQVTLYASDTGAALATFTLPPAYHGQRNLDITALSDGTVAIRGQIGFSITLLIYSRAGTLLRQVPAVPGTTRVSQIYTGSGRTFGADGTTVYLLNADSLYKVDTVTGVTTKVDTTSEYNDRGLKDNADSFTVSAANRLLVWIGDHEKFNCNDLDTWTRVAEIPYVTNDMLTSVKFDISQTGVFYIVRGGKLVVL